MSRLDVRKTYKLYIGGSFPRSESGRTFTATDVNGDFLANAAHASRKDARDAVTAARGAFDAWSSRTPYNRGQILYRIAEMLEGRREQFVSVARAASGLDDGDAHAVVDATIDRWIWYAGWADKLAQVAGNPNPVSGPFFNLSSPEPTGVVAVLAPRESGLLGLASVIAPAIVSGNTVVVAASETDPVPACTLAEVMSTSDVPGGVVNILTGPLAGTAPTLAAHMDVNAIDLTGADRQVTQELEVAAADNLKRVIRANTRDWAEEPPLSAMTGYLETKTVWHPMGQ